MKKFFYALLSMSVSITLLLCVFGISVHATSYYTTNYVNGYTYEWDTTLETACIRSASPTFWNGEVVVPTEYKNYPITKIGERAFANCSNITSIVIPDSVTAIEDGAFSKCSKAINITIPKSVTDIGDSAFYWCSSLTSITLPNGITRIGVTAFQNCSNLTSITLPVTVKNIDHMAFYECSKLTDVWYIGSQTDRNNIVIDDFNNKLTNATWHYDSCPVGAPHSYDNDCDDTCNGCGKKRTASGHSYDNACDTQCNICNGIRTVSHTYDNSCDTQCNVCNSSRTISHTYGEWEVTKQASCTESGTKTRKCGVCSKTESDTISSLGHSFSTEWTTDKKATCTTEGSKSNHCTRCSATINDTTIVPSGHSWGKWVTEKKATDKTEGLSIRKCNECDLKETQTIAKLAADGHTHKFGEWQIIKAATCKEKGNTARTCSVCKEQEQKDLLATGHQVGEWVKTSATCTNDGNRERVCVICNETEKIKIKALGHDFENPVVIKEPTDNEKGIKQGKCKRCGEETTEEIPALLSDNVSNTDSNKKPDGAIGGNEDKNTNNNWVIWTIIGVLVLVGIGFGVYLILKKNRPNNQE